jgi:hypothetical protein
MPPSAATLWALPDIKLTEGCWPTFARSVAKQPAMRRVSGQCAPLHHTALNFVEFRTACVVFTVAARTQGERRSSGYGVAQV